MLIFLGFICATDKIHLIERVDTAFPRVVAGGSPSARGRSETGVSRRQGERAAVERQTERHLLFDSALTQPVLYRPVLQSRTARRVALHCFSEKLRAHMVQCAIQAFHLKICVSTTLRFRSVPVSSARGNNGAFRPV